MTFFYLLFLGRIPKDQASMVSETQVLVPLTSMVPQGQAVVEEEGEATTVLLSELLMGTSTNLSDSEAQVEEINREEVVGLFGLMSPMSFK